MVSSNKILVTGANGFIGRVLCSFLQSKGQIVRALLRRELAGPWDEIVLGDFTSESFSPDYLSGVSAVFHLAGKAHTLSETKGEESAYKQVNVVGTKRLLYAAELFQLRQFIFFSSVKTVGEGLNKIISETSCLPPETHYGRSKLDAEKLVLNSTIPHVAIIRPSMVYGPGNPGNLRKMVSWISKGYFPPFPKINNRRSMVHVEDVVQAAILAAENSRAHKQTYIVTDGQVYSTRQIYEWIIQALGKPIPNWTVPLPILQGAARIGDIIGTIRGKSFPLNSISLRKLIGSAAYSSAKIRKELGFLPNYTLEKSLHDIVKTYLKEKICI